MKTNQIILFIVVALLLGGCAAQNHSHELATEATKSGFLLGLWHGIISPFTFFISLFWDSVKIYDINNNGGWYDFGFVLGAGILFSSSRGK